MSCTMDSGGFPGSSAGKESTCNAGDPSLLPGLGRFPWRRVRLPTPGFLGFPGGSDGKESPAVQETWVQSLDWEDLLEKGVATHSSILAWRIPMDRGACGLQPMGSQRVGDDWATKQSTARGRCS